MIKSISYLVTKNERKHVISKNGKFILVRRRSSRYGRDIDSKTFTAKSFVEYVKNRDPFITLDDGTKMRVYRGGNSADVVIETICVVESHDEKLALKLSKTIIPDYSDYTDFEW